MVRKVRVSEVASRAATQLGRRQYPESTAAVGEVPKEFIEEMVAGKKENDENIRKIQVECRRAFSKTCLRQQTDSIGDP